MWKRTKVCKSARKTSKINQYTQRYSKRARPWRTNHAISTATAGYISCMACLLPIYLVRRLWSVHCVGVVDQSTIRRSDHITDAFVSQHWQRVPSSFRMRLPCWRIKVLQGTAPRYKSPLVRVSDILTRVGVVSVLSALLARPRRHFNYPLLAVEHLRFAACSDMKRSVARLSTTTNLANYFVFDWKHISIGDLLQTSRSRPRLCYTLSDGR